MRKKYIVSDMFPVYSSQPLDSTSLSLALSLSLSLSLFSIHDVMSTSYLIAGVLAL